MYDNLIWSLAIVNAQSLVVFCLIVIILDWARTIIFKD